MTIPYRGENNNMSIYSSHEAISKVNNISAYQNFILVRMVNSYSLRSDRPPPV